MRLCLIILFLTFCFTGWMQNLVKDSLFQDLEFEWHRTPFSKGVIEPQNVEGQSVAAFGFRVNSSQVDPNFIIAQLLEEMLAGEVYTIELTIKKDRFSPFSIKEFQLYFGSSFNERVSFLHGAFKEQMVRFEMKDVPTTSFVKMTISYEAQGGEEYIYMGSLYQKFTLEDFTELGLLLVDRSYGEIPYNSGYFVRKIAVKASGKTGGKMKKNQKENWYNLRSNQSNLIINGGAETPLVKKYFVNDYTHDSRGSLIAPFVYSLTSSCPGVVQLDSNDYRSIYNVNQLCYMGDGQFILDALKTNLYHDYQESISKQEGKEYDTYHIYEKSPVQTILPYALGEYLVLVLREPLEHDKTYHWSSMIKINENSSYGVRHLGIHFLEKFPENVSDSLWSRYPDNVIDVEHLAASQAWSELNSNYLARGGERFVVIGHLPALDGIVKNQTFVREFHDDCGPNEYNCSDRYVYYKDSLFARYQLDNMVLTEGAVDNHYSIVYEPGKRVQLEIIFNEIKKSGAAKEKLEKVKEVLVNAQQVLRVEDAICVVDQRKKEPVILEPNPIINKKKILRKINKPKPVKKIKNSELLPQIILFGEGKDEVNINHLVLVGDENLDISPSEKKLIRFVNNEGNLTVFYVGDKGGLEAFSQQFKTLGDVLIISAEQLSADQMIRILITEN